MYMIMLLGLLAVLALAVKIVSVKAQLQGFREASRVIGDGEYHRSADHSLVGVLAIIGLVAVYTLHFWAGMAPSALGE